MEEQACCCCCCYISISMRHGHPHRCLCLLLVVLHIGPSGGLLRLVDRLVLGRRSRSLLTVIVLPAAGSPQTADPKASFECATRVRVAAHRSICVRAHRPPPSELKIMLKFARSCSSALISLFPLLLLIHRVTRSAHQWSAQQQ